MMHVVVVGAGRMGAGIAHAFLVAGASVDLRDVSVSAVENGMSSIRASLSTAASRGSLAEPVDEALSRLTSSAGLEALGAPDLVVEAVPEDLELKRNVWRQVAQSTPATAVLATNTSSISVEDLAAAVPSPDRFLGLHFFNPVPVSKLVEIVRSPFTSDDVADAARNWVAAIGKESITVSDSPGFASSRLGLATGLEAIRMLEEGVASADEIDRAMVLGYGYPIGPLRLTDIVGLDVRLEIARYLESTLGPRFAPPGLLRRKVAAGELGRKSGRGFFEWDAVAAPVREPGA